MSRARELAKLGNENIIDTDANNYIGLGTQVPTNPATSANTQLVSAGIITAYKFWGDGANLTGIGVTLNVRTNSIIVSGASTLTGAVNIDSTTESTSITTGALIVDGGTGVAKNLFVGDAIDVAKDINVGAAATIAGIVTTGKDVYVGDALDVAKDIHVGAAATIVGAVKVTNTTASTSTSTGSLIVSGGVGIAGDVWVGAGLSVAGTLTYEDVTNVDSVGVVTAKSGVNVSGGQLTVGSGITMGIAGVATFSGTADIHLLDDVRLKLGDGTDFQIWHDGSNPYLLNSTGSLHLKSNNHVYIQDYDGNVMADFNEDGSVELYHNSNKKFETTNDGVVVTGIVTCAGIAYTGGLLRENCNITAGKLSDNTNIDLVNGMFHHYTTTESTTCTPNIRYSATKSLNNMMEIGDAITVAVATSAAAGGYSAEWTIDGNAVTEQWVGGSAPSAGGADGYDLYTFNIIKTASATFTVIGNVVNAT